MILDLGARICPFFVANLRNSQLLRAIRASKGQIIITDLFGPDLFRDSLRITDVFLSPSLSYRSEVFARLCTAMPVRVRR